MPLLYSTAREKCLDCFQNDFDVQPKRAVFDVKNIVRQFLASQFHVRAVMRMVFLVNLRPARKSRLDKVADIVIRNFFVVDSDAGRQLGSRTDKRNVTAQNIPELRQFIYACRAQKVANASDFVLFVRVGCKVGVVARHGAEFVKPDGFTVLAHAVLDNKNLAAVF